MSRPEQFDILILGSGKSGKLLAWHMAQSGRRAAVVERRWIGGSCPNIACLPSKNEIWSAKVAHLAREGVRFGVVTGPVTTDMATVVKRKRDMVQREIDAHLHNYKTTGAELIMGSGRFVAPKTLEVHLNDGGTRALAGDRVFINVGTHAAIPPVPGLEAARPLTHIEVLELDYLPAHLIVLGAGYIGLELAQAYRRFGSRVTVIEPGPQLMGREDPDVAAEVQRILGDEDIRFLLATQALNVHGRSGEDVRVAVRTPSGEQQIEGTDILVAAGRSPNTKRSGSSRPASPWTRADIFASTNGWRPPRPRSGPWGIALAARSSRTSPAMIFGSSGTTWPGECTARVIAWYPTACSPTRNSRT
jgi:pyruvate/2-oxoglutarate dehydrogenase complex dihydrolipoamide dehydrogenase (E3) component